MPYTKHNIISDIGNIVNLRSIFIFEPISRLRFSKHVTPAARPMFDPGGRCHWGNLSRHSQKSCFFLLVWLNFWKLSLFIYAYGIPRHPPPPPIFGLDLYPRKTRSVAPSEIYLKSVTDTKPSKRIPNRRGKHLVDV